MGRYPERNIPEEKIYKRMSHRELVDETTQEKFNQDIIAPWQDLRPKEDDFVDVYSEREINEDKRTAAEVKAEFVKKKQSSVGLEYLLMEGIYNHRWLSRKDLEVYVSPTAEHDDFNGHTDLVVRFDDPEEKESYYLGIDATTAQDRSWTDQKFKFLAGKIRRGVLPHVKYYEDEKTGQKGKIFLPTVVVGVDAEKTFQLMKTCLENPSALNRDPVQLEFLEQIELQLSVALDWLLRNRIRIRKERVPGSNDRLAQFCAKHKETIERKGNKLAHTVFTYSGLLEKIIAIRKEKEASLGPVPQEEEARMPRAAISEFYV